MEPFAPRRGACVGGRLGSSHSAPEPTLLFVSPWSVHKFGGTSLADADRYANAGRLVTEASGRPFVVVSAMAGVTDALIGLVESASQAVPQTDAESVVARVAFVGRSLLSEAEAERFVARCAQDGATIGEVLRACNLLRDDGETVTALVAGYGEQWSARLLAAHLRDRGLSATSLDARAVLQLTPDGELDEASSRRDLSAWLESHQNTEAVVVTGFVATGPNGRPATLGRNGSDLSATLFAGLTDAERVTIWTDVAGVLTADPRRVETARPVPRMSYAEAMELAYFGAKVLHPRTLGPAARAGIPIQIKSALEPEHPGTTIDAEGDREVPVKGITTIEDMALVELSGRGLIGVPGAARRLFGVLESARLSVVLISQASSEHSICFAVPANQGPRAAQLVDEAFFAERYRGEVGAAVVRTGCAILAVVGDGMAGRPGVAARTFGALGRAAVNVRAIAQGSSERNVSVVVDEHDADRALRAVHAGFWLSKPTLNLAIVGTGVVGGALVEQLRARLPELGEAVGVELRLKAIARSRRMLLGEPVLEPTADWRARLDAGSPADLRTLIAHLTTDGAPHAAVVDLSASDDLADHYPAWLASGVHVVTANKRAGSGPYERFARTQNAARGKSAAFLYETTVGAGLPILGTLRDLIDTGDRVHAIEGLLSGTLSWLFSTWDGKTPFSATVREAKRRGFTEPDVRDDLSGMDVARKLVILAREVGQPATLEQVRVENLVPDGLQDMDAAEALERLESIDAPLARRLEAAQAEGKVLRYAAHYRGGRLEVGLKSFPLDHPFASSKGTDNVVQIETDRYRERPMVIQGPGAGPEVTAAGVFAELIRLTRSFGR